MENIWSRFFFPHHPLSCLERPSASLPHCPVDKRLCENVGGMEGKSEPIKPKFEPIGIKSEPIGLKFEPLGFQSKRLKLAKLESGFGTPLREHSGLLDHPCF
jgi:hypothetical protein